MTCTDHVRAVVLSLLATTFLVFAPAPSWAKQRRQAIERFRAHAYNADLGRISRLDVVIFEWTPPEERQALMTTFAAGGGEALYDGLHDAGVKGYLKLPQSLAYDMKYAWQLEADGKRRIVLASDRPLGFLEVTRHARSRDYNVSLVILELDPETGEGEGTAMAGAELSVDEATGRLQVQFRGTQPTRLSNVEPWKRKKKKKKGP